MSEIQPSCQNGTPGFFNRSWTGWHHYQVIGAAETIILPGLIGIICSTGLVGNILIAFTIISLFQSPEDIYSRYLHLQSGYSRFGSYHWHALSHSPMGTWRRVRARQPSLHRRYLPGCMQPAYMQCHYDCNEFGQIARSCPAILPNLPENKIKDNSIFVYGYTTSIARQRAMRFTKMVLALASVSVVSAAPFHVIQLMNLQVSQLTLTFYVSYYISVCLSYTSSSINPFPYILPTGNVQKRLRRCTKVEVRWQNRMSASSKTSSSQVFERKVLFQEKCILYV